MTIAFIFIYINILPNIFNNLLNWDPVSTNAPLETARKITLGWNILMKSLAVWINTLFFPFQVISYIRGPFLFIYNFHPTDSFERYSVGVEEAGEYRVSNTLLPIYNFWNYRSCSITTIFYFKSIHFLKYFWNLNKVFKN